MVVLWGGAVSYERGTPVPAIDTPIEERESRFQLGQDEPASG